jgi:two-component system chemotaxis response regulator CheY
MNKDISILVVDDSAFMRQYIIGFLHELGYEKISEAGNGPAALNAVNESMPDVVLLDMIMPIMDGMEALEKLVELNARVIVVTAMGQRITIVKAIEKGARGYFVKPFFTAHELGRKIEDVINED